VLPVAEVLPGAVDVALVPVVVSVADGLVPVVLLGDVVLPAPGIDEPVIEPLPDAIVTVCAWYRPSPSVW
jgi:hypothetical protein